MNNRKKGHDLERQVVNDLKELFPFAKTTRNSSKMLDDNGVDINFVPFLLQCKRGYSKNRPKYEEEYKKVHDRKILNYPENHVIHQLPYILLHKMDSELKGKKYPREMFQCTMDYEFFLWLINNIDKTVLKSLPVLC